jgi:dihydroorotate dehydrogenase
VIYAAARPLLFRLPAETAHDVGLRALAIASGLHLLPGRPLPAAPVRCMGLEFPNAVGLAAGLDKNGAHIDALAGLGFGFIEVGTVTPRPQPGNPRPRLFRIERARALINRMGFNNLGVDRLARNAGQAHYRGILGINIGKNFDTPIERAAADYVACMRKVYGLASYLTVNISSPNTRNLRQLQQADQLDRLLDEIKTEHARLAEAHGRHVPVALKIAPDLSEDQIADVGALLVQYRIDAVIATNTTTGRTGVEGLPHAQESGGLSGAPLRERSTWVVRQLAGSLGGRVPIIGVGGILSAADAQEKLAAGATLVQLYTGLVYRGPALIGECVRALAAAPPAMAGS